MPTMIDKLNDILDEKQSKIIPENIKAGITAFGINGIMKNQMPSDIHVFDITPLFGNNYPYMYRTTNKYAMMYKSENNDDIPILINLFTERYIELDSDHIPNHPHNFYICETQDGGVVLMIGTKLEKYNANLELIQTYYTFSSKKTPLYDAYKGYGNGVGPYMIGNYSPICLSEENKLLVLNTTNSLIEEWNVPVQSEPHIPYPNYVAFANGNIIYTVNLTTKEVTETQATSSLNKWSWSNNKRNEVSYRLCVDNKVCLKNGTWKNIDYSVIQWADADYMIYSKTANSVSTVYKLNRTTGDVETIGTFTGSNTIYGDEGWSSIYDNGYLYIQNSKSILKPDGTELNTLYYNTSYYDYSTRQTVIEKHDITDDIHWIQAGDGTILGYLNNVVFIVSDFSTGECSYKLLLPDYASNKHIYINEKMDYTYNNVNYTLFYATGRLAYSREGIYSSNGVEPFVWDGTNITRLFNYAGMSISGESGGNYFEFEWDAKKIDLDDGFMISLYAKPSTEGMNYGNFYGPRVNLYYTTEHVNDIKVSSLYGGPNIGGNYAFIAETMFTDGEKVYICDALETETSDMGDYWNYPDALSKGHYLIWATNNN